MAPTSLPLAIVLCVGFVHAQSAGSVVFNAGSGPGVIDCANLTYENFDVTVDGVTLTVDCAHTFHSLRLSNGAILTHSPGTPLALTVTTNVVIDPGCFIDVSEKGYDWADPSLGPGPGSGPAQGSIGASHGGQGYAILRRDAPRAYGSMLQPVTMGSAGGNSPPSLGGRGGGAVRLIVGGQLTLSGGIRANGGFGASGGSGGSVWVVAQSVFGFGTISAGGGNGFAGGGGGGGRIALHDAAASFLGAAVARAGVAGSGGRGGAGTVVKVSVGQPLGHLILDNGGLSGVTEFSQTVVLSQLTVRGGAILSPVPNDPSLVLDVRGDVTIATDGIMSATGLGYDHAVNGGGPGVGGTSPGLLSGGGSHGGMGSPGFSNLWPLVTTVGLFDQPIEMGSAGGSAPPTLGAAGGGVFRVLVTGTLTVNGRIESNGIGGINSAVGGGAGGSIWITAGVVSGTGVIEANGGGGNAAGGGGRVALEYASDNFTGSASAYGGIGFSGSGGAGTVYKRDTGQSAGELVLDNLGRSGTTDFIGAVVVQTLTIRNNAVLSHPPGDGSLDLAVQGAMSVDASAAVDVTGRGFGPEIGPGAGAGDGINGGGGGGHGSGGVIGTSLVAGGYTYGNITAPDTLGSGGGNGYLQNVGGSGGGKVKLTVGGTLTLDGRVTADGAPSTYVIGNRGGGGGGAGGSINMILGSLTGGGLIQARGAVGAFGGGGGGGGRVAIDSPNTAGFTQAIDTSGAGGARDGTYHLSTQPSYALELTNLRSGQTAVFRVVGATTNYLQFVSYSLTGVGSTPISVPGIGSLALQLDTPFFFPFFLPNGNGVGTVTVNVPSGLTGTPVWAQAVEVGPPSIRSSRNLIQAVVTQ